MAVDVQYVINKSIAGLSQYKNIRGAMGEGG